MRIIARPVLNAFAETHPEIASALNGWYHLVKRATYRTPNELKQDFPQASLLGDGITIFNIGSCRLEVHMRYDVGIVFIRSIDTHTDYERRNKARKKK
jgi:mRNA interferase HigB